MTNKRFLTVWLATSVVTLVLNGIFHGIVAASFFDKNFEGLGSVAVKMEDFNPLPVAILEFILVFVLAWILSKMNRASITLQDAVLTGALFEFSTAVTWSLANTATFIFWPLAVTIGDPIWHAGVGALAGWMIYRFGLQGS